MQTLISFTSFNDESGETTERLNRFKKWLWSVVEKMSAREKQDLVSVICEFHKKIVFLGIFKFFELLLKGILLDGFTGTSGV